MKHRALFATVVILVLALATCAYSAQLNFTPVMTVSEEYNDNIFLAPDNEEDDFITRVSLGGTLELLGRTAGAELTYLPAYEWYHDYDDFDGWTHYLLARTWYNFTPNNIFRNLSLFVTATNVFVLTQYSGLDPELPQFNGGIDNNIYPVSRNFLIGVKADF